ncbi:MAG: M48 family metalloprotease [Candidatus Bathyarchaeota archaeon]|nr:MAG: M48 family metalloprotease [Candidatus Bathyarchaeota archaeon]
MARLARLKLSMSVSILLVTGIFAVFLVILFFLFQLSLTSALILTLFGVALFVLVQYMIGPEMVRWTTKLRYLQPGEHPWLESTVKELAEKSGLPMPRLAIVPDQTPNAFVFGRTTNGATLAVHEGLLRQLNQAEVRGVIAHELGHIKHSDFIVMTVLSALPLIAYLIARLGFATARVSRGGRRKDNEASLQALIFVAAAVSYIVYIATLLCVMRLSRLREHYADAYSAYLSGEPRQLESALTKISYGLSLSPKPPHGARTLYIGDPALAKQECRGLLQRKAQYDLDKDGVLDERELALAMEQEAKSRWTAVNTLFTTHPPTFQRILLLREIGKEMASGQYRSDRIYAHV